MTCKSALLPSALAIFTLFAANVPANDQKPSSEVEEHTAVTEVEVVSVGPTELPEIKTITEAETAVVLSAAKPVFVFKHSTTCSISKRASERLSAYVKENWPDKDAESAPGFVWLKVVESRPVSKYLEQRFEVKHESPQVLLLDKGKVVWHQSHDEITAEAMATALKQLDNNGEAKKP